MFSRLRLKEVRSRLKPNNYQNECITYVGSPADLRSMRGEFFDNEFCFLNEAVNPPLSEPPDADLPNGRADFVIRVFRWKLPGAGKVWLTGFGSSVNEPDRPN